MKIYFDAGRIQIHASWLPIINLFATILTVSGPRINRDGYVDWYVPATAVKSLASHAMKVALPIMVRKWKYISTVDAVQTQVRCK